MLRVGGFIFFREYDEYFLVSEGIAGRLLLLSVPTAEGMRAQWRAE